MTTTEFTDPLTESEFDALLRLLDRVICQEEDALAPSSWLATLTETYNQIAELRRVRG